MKKKAIDLKNSNSSKRKVNHLQNAIISLSKRIRKKNGEELKSYECRSNRSIKVHIIWRLAINHHKRRVIRLPILY